MQIDFILILCAGLGTRMGPIGKKLPKALWPILNKNLLDLQLKFCEKIGVRKIFINTHYLAEEIESFVSSYNSNLSVEILHEVELLGSGGAIHNLAQNSSVNYKGKLLIINADQFLFFEDLYWKLALSSLKKYHAVLFMIQVSKNTNYNETVIENNLLVDIKKNIEHKNDFFTYSGLGLVNLDTLSVVKGYSNFFESVADYKKNKIFAIELKKYEYWDFGTSEIYFENLFKLIKLKTENEKSDFVEFLNSSGVDFSKASNYISNEYLAIDLSGNSIFEKKSIHFKNIFQIV